MRDSIMKILNTMGNSILVTALVVSGGVFADSGGIKYEESPLNSTYQLIENKEFEQAIVELDQDVESLLGYSNRKLKNYNVALKYYQHALSINPKHKGANEYFGELYLEIG